MKYIKKEHTVNAIRFIACGRVNSAYGEGGVMYNTADVASMVGCSVHIHYSDEMVYLGSHRIAGMVPLDWWVVDPGDGGPCIILSPDEFPVKYKPVV